MPNFRDCSLCVGYAGKDLLDANDKFFTVCKKIEQGTKVSEFEWRDAVKNMENIFRRLDAGRYCVCKD